MTETLLITVREGVEIALIIGILLLSLKKLGRQRLNKWVHLGLGAAVALSVAVALVLEKLSLDFELFEGYLMFAAAALVTSMIVWMWSTSTGIKKDIEQKVGEVVQQSKTTFALSSGVFLFAFLMVVREGIETVVFLRAASGGGAFSSGVIGIILGVSLSIVFGILFVKGGLHIDIGRFLRITAIVLLVFVAQLVINGVHEFYELGVFPASPTMMGIVGPIVRNNLLFILAIISIPAIMFIVPSKAGMKKDVANRKWQLSAGILSLSVIFFLGFGGIFKAKSAVEISAPQFVEEHGGIVRIPVKELVDGKLHRFAWTDETGTHIRFFAIRTGTGSFSTAFDACRACYNYGFYYMRDGELICSVCEAPSELTKLAVATEVDESQSGSMEGMGCAPLYLSSRIVGDNIQVSVQELSRNKKFFQTSLDLKTMTFTPSGKE